MVLIIRTCLVMMSKLQSFILCQPLQFERDGAFTNLCVEHVLTLCFSWRSILNNHHGMRTSGLIIMCVNGQSFVWHEIGRSCIVLSVKCQISR